MLMNAEAQTLQESGERIFPRPVPSGDLLQGLLRSAAFPHSVTDIRVIETQVTCGMVWKRRRWREQDLQEHFPHVGYFWRAVR